MHYQNLQIVNVNIRKYMNTIKFVKNQKKESHKM